MGNIKPHVLEEFLAEFSTPIGEEVSPTWILLVDEASNIKGNGIRIVLEIP